MQNTQNPHAIVMVRPLFFDVNGETAIDNHFQGVGSPTDRADAIAEFDQMVATLKSAGVDVLVFDQTRPDTPDAVFPNNWFSTHPDGTLVLYPMKAPSRQRERRADIPATLADRFRVTRTINLTKAEADARALEGTGAIVFDHPARYAFMARSPRADDAILSELCLEVGYRPVVFDATDRAGKPIYHSNVMMAVGANTALIGGETIADPKQRATMLDLIQSPHRTVIDLTHDQIEAFAGNALEVDSEDGPMLILSETAFNALTTGQRKDLSQKVALLPVAIPTIEKSGGSARCMMAGIHLPTA